MGAIRWINRRRWFFPLLWALLAALLALGPRWPSGVILKPLLLAAVGAVFFKINPRLMGREILALVRQMGQTCDPEPLLDACREVTQRRQRLGGRPRYYLQVQLAASEAAGRMGRYDEAERLLKTVLFRYAQYGFLGQLQTEAYACLIMLWLGRFEDARSWLREAEKKVEKMPDGAGADVWRSALESRRRLYRLKTEGGSEELLSELQDELAGTANESLLNQVCGHMNAARCLLDLGRRAEARPHLEFVAAHGNKLALRTQAEERLREPDAAKIPAAPERAP